MQIQASSWRLSDYVWEALWIGQDNISHSEYFLRLDKGYWAVHMDKVFTEEFDLCSVIAADRRRISIFFRYCIICLHTLMHTDFFLKEFQKCELIGPNIFT